MKFIIKALVVSILWLPVLSRAQMEMPGEAWEMQNMNCLDIQYEAYYAGELLTHYLDAGVDYEYANYLSRASELADAANDCVNKDRNSFCVWGCTTR